jgi:hypothetical protein
LEPGNAVYREWSAKIEAVIAATGLAAGELHAFIANCQLDLGFDLPDSSSYRQDRRVDDIEALARFFMRCVTDSSGRRDQRPYSGSNHKRRQIGTFFFVPRADFRGLSGGLWPPGLLRVTPVNRLERRPTGISPLVNLTNLWPKWFRFWIRDIPSLGGPFASSAARPTKAVISRLHTKSSIEAEQVCWFQFLQPNLMKRMRIGQN